MPPTEVTQGLGCKGVVLGSNSVVLGCSTWVPPTEVTHGLLPGVSGTNLREDPGSAYPRTRV